ncbi:VOC family protein [Brevibacillus invocatus]|uniref:Extradiol dioxygenase n=1 Tax=Brevibacillus invocatus TaxID=173959 RepID=A0A3M8C3S0_9BACL|nr:VOC family protein [Brevibacillus invocatus]MCM3082043.1 VOC family protein [Brevibacillus invocatus]MCM3432454.1 VOC family protein [Brevibacillus invocatus]RNB69555.1 extradiol dioxygenase [Brevibacillus invocatus]
MTKELWINLPVKDLGKSKAFFADIGFPFNPKYPNHDEGASLLIGEKNIVVMLFPEPAFKSFTRNEVTDTKQATEVLLSIDADSKEEVDELIRKVEAAGGTIYSKPQANGWMYGAGFADLDGHRWNVLHMDPTLMPKG